MNKSVDRDAKESLDIFKYPVKIYEMLVQCEQIPWKTFITYNNCESAQ